MVDRRPRPFSSPRFQPSFSFWIIAKQPFSLASGLVTESAVTLPENVKVCGSSASIEYTG